MKKNTLKSLFACFGRHRRFKVFKKLGTTKLSLIFLFLFFALLFVFVLLITSKKLFLRWKKLENFNKRKNSYI